MSRPTGSWSWSIHITYAAPPIYESVIELTRYFKSHPPWSKCDNLEVRAPTPLEMGHIVFSLGGNNSTEN